MPHFRSEDLPLLKQNRKQVQVSGRYASFSRSLVLSFGTCTDTGRITLLVTAVADALGVDPSQLPVAVTAPEYMEQKATIDALFALAFGLYTHVAPLPPVAGAPRLVKLLTVDLEGITGGKIAVETDMVEA